MFIRVSDKVMRTCVIDGWSVEQTFELVAGSPDCVDYALSRSRCRSQQTADLFPNLRLLRVGETWLTSRRLRGKKTYAADGENNCRINNITENGLQNPSENHLSTLIKMSGKTDYWRKKYNNNNQKMALNVKTLLCKQRNL
jgi:hypothetical protein